MTPRNGMVLRQLSTSRAGGLSQEWQRMAAGGVGVVGVSAVAYYLFASDSNDEEMKSPEKLDAQASGESQKEDPSGEAKDATETVPSKMESETVEQTDNAGNEKAAQETSDKAVVSDKSENESSESEPALETSASVLDEPVEELAVKLAETPADEPVDEPVEQPADKPSEKNVEQLADETSEKPVVSKPVDEPLDQTTKEPADEPLDEPTDEPLDEPADEPADEPTDEPADEPLDEPADESNEVNEKDSEESSEKEKFVWDYEPVPRDYMAVFLDQESSAKLRERFPPAFENECYDHMTVVFEPTREQVLEQDDLLTNDEVVHVIAHAQDEFCQTLLVEVENPHIQSQNKYAHITLSYKSVAETEASIDAKYSNTLLYRLAAERPAREVFYLKRGVKEPLEWSGMLPVAGNYPESSATVTNVQSEALTVSGVYCLKSKMDWSDGIKCTYRRENECAFCKFMKGGPCRKVFMEWEDCVTGAGKEDNEFVDRCAAQTMKLKTCVDEFPNYYSVLDEKPEGEKDDVDAAEPSSSTEGEQAAAVTPIDEKSADNSVISKEDDASNETVEISEARE